MKTLIGGAVAAVLGIIGLSVWWKPFLQLLAGAIPAMLLLGGGLAAAGQSSAGVSFRGIDPEQDAQVSQIHKHVAQGQWLSAAHPEKVVLGRRLLRTLGVGLGDEIIALSQAADGSVANDVVVSASALEINGSVGGDVRGEVARAEESTPPQFMPFFPGAVPVVEPGLRVASGAEVGGEVHVKETTVEVDISPPDARSLLTGGLARTITGRIGEFIALLIVGGLLLWLWPAAVERSQRSAGERPLASAGSGCLLLIIFAAGVPLACAVTGGLAALGGLITFGQLSGAILGLSWTAIGFIVAAFSFVVSMVAKVIVAFWAGRWILDRLAPERQPGYWTDFASLALGAFIYEILRAIPVIGLIIAVIVTLVGLGAAYFVLRDTFRPSPPKEIPGAAKPEPA